MNKIIGIVSWLPSDDSRDLRFSRVVRLINQIKELWPDIPAIILAQNWKIDEIETISAISDKVLINNTLERLGILKARKTLRQLLLKTAADYFILFDDDAIIENTNNGNEKIIQLMEEHPHGWAFSTHFVNDVPPAKYNPFAHSQLNLCCLSRYIFEKEDFPDIDPERSQGFEDRIYTMTILCKYPDLQWLIPDTIYCTHFKNPNETAPSTWSKRQKYKWKEMRANTEKIEYEIMQRYNYKKTN